MLVTAIATSWSRPTVSDHADGAAPLARAGCARGHREPEYSGAVECAAHQGEGRMLTVDQARQHRTKVTKGPGSRAAGLAMAFKLIQSAQDHWRSVNAPHLVALVRAGAVFSNGVLIERPEQAAA